MNYAPIILFVYNRPWHTKQTIESLKQNELASKSQLFIYSDAPKKSAHDLQVNEVRNYLKSIVGFKDVTIIERERNYGLANSIIQGVTEVVNQYGKVIVLEDDLITSPYFLSFMNNALDLYQNQTNVWHISGWNYYLKTKQKVESFFWRVMNCWGWATWSDRWMHFEKDVESTIANFSKSDIKKFNVDGAFNFWRQVLDNKSGKINTWAIFWYATIFKHNGLCLNPMSTHVQNIGGDGSGTHTKSGDILNVDVSHKKNIVFPSDICENSDVIEELKQYLRHEKNRQRFNTLKTFIYKGFK